MDKKPSAKVFIDASNVFFAQKRLGWLIDWKKLNTLLHTEFDLKEIKYYVAIKTESNEKDGFLKFLEKMNFKIITKPLKKIKTLVFDEKGKSQEVIIHKGNFDVEITRDTLLDKEKYKYLVLFSGDSDFAVLKSNWTKLGKKLIVFTSKKTLSWELKIAAEKIYFFENLKDKIFRQNWVLTKTSKNDKNRLLDRTQRA